jgi:DNA-binding transcriptional regulator YdaS (Cro superfamily)
VSRKTSLEGRWLALAEKAGGVHALASALGVAPSSLYRWGLGRPISALARVAVQRYAKRRRMPDPTASQ